MGGRRKSSEKEEESSETKSAGGVCEKEGAEVRSNCSLRARGRLYVVSGQLPRRGGARHDAHLLRRSRDAAVALHVSRAGRTLWAHDDSPASAGPRRAHHGPGGYCQPSINQGMLGWASTTLDTRRVRFAKDQVYMPGELARQNGLARAWRGSKGSWSRYSAALSPGQPPLKGGQRKTLHRAFPPSRRFLRWKASSAARTWALRRPQSDRASARGDDGATVPLW
jgi:hypothetical protein